MEKENTESTDTDQDIISLDLNSDTVGEEQEIVVEELEIVEEEEELVEEDSNNEVPVSEEERKILRAKRFTFELKKETPSTSKNPSLITLHERMGVDVNTRTNSLHLHCTGDLLTEHVFDYFTSSSPVGVEWLSENSCNATWLDEESCATALVNHSVYIKDQPGAPSDLADEEEYVRFKDVRMALPPGNWRKGKAFPLAPNLIIRYANVFDKKQHLRPRRRSHSVHLDEGDEVSEKLEVSPDNPNPWVNIAKRWGDYESRVQAANPGPSGLHIGRANRADAREVINRRRTQSLCEDSDDEDDDEGINIYIPSGLSMHADVEEKLLKQRKAHSSSIVLAPDDLRHRLDRKRNLQKTRSLSRESPIHDDLRRSLKSKQDKSSKRSSRRDWESSSDSELERDKKRHSSFRDLRQKLQRSSRKDSRKFVPLPLTIEIENDLYCEKKTENQDSVEKDKKDD